MPITDAPSGKPWFSALTPPSARPRRS